MSTGGGGGGPGGSGGLFSGGTMPGGHAVEGVTSFKQRFKHTQRHFLSKSKQSLSSSPDVGCSGKEAEGRVGTAGWEGDSLTMFIKVSTARPRAPTRPGTAVLTAGHPCGELLLPEQRLIPSRRQMWRCAASPQGGLGERGRAVLDRANTKPSPAHRWQPQCPLPATPALLSAHLTPEDLHEGTDCPEHEKKKLCFLPPAP